MTGETVRLLGGFGRRYAAAVRVGTLVPIGAIALLRPAPGAFAGTLVAVLMAVAWTAGHCWWLARGAGRTGALAATLDVTALLTICLSVLWTDAVAASNTGWLRLLVTFACVTWQWHTTLTTGLVATAVLAVGSLALILVSDPRDVSLVQAQLWVPATALLSRAAWVLVTRAAQRTDRMASSAESARRASAVAAAVRAEERELVNALHDTAATTLLMVGTGQVPPGAGWLAGQARRDLARLRADGGPRPDRADLVDQVRADLDASHLTVRIDGPPVLWLPFEVATAVAGAVREALNNVRRHAGTDHATVRVDGDERALRVVIADEGTGFDAQGAVPGARRGLRESVHGRMADIGGTATITSAESAGTVVCLEWRADG